MLIFYYQGKLEVGDQIWREDSRAPSGGCDHMVFVSILEIPEVGRHLWVGCLMPFVKEQEVDFFLLRSYV